MSFITTHMTFIYYLPTFINWMISCTFLTNQHIHYWIRFIHTLILKILIQCIINTFSWWNICCDIFIWNVKVIIDILSNSSSIILNDSIETWFELLCNFFLGNDASFAIFRWILLGSLSFIDSIRSIPLCLFKKISNLLTLLSLPNLDCPFSINGKPNGWHVISSQAFFNFC